MGDMIVVRVAIDNIKGYFILVATYRIDISTGFGIQNNIRHCVS